MKATVVEEGLAYKEDEDIEVKMSKFNETTPSTSKKANETLYTVHMSSCTVIATIDSKIRTMYHVQGGDVNPKFYDKLVDLIADNATIVFSDGASGASKASAQDKLDKIKEEIESRMPDAKLTFKLFYTAIQGDEVEGQQNPLPGSLVLRGDGSYGRALRPVFSDEEDEDEDDDEDDE